ncbi:MAG: sulfur carrier protein ThiS [Mariprofundaceae bacterium]|nr:sulfur carrier protein ThiS [Mariprofundaceae bacterium]
MNIQLNGEQKEIEAATIGELVIELGLEKRTVAVEQNLEVVPKSKYADTVIEAGDRIEVVHMIGGG